MEYEAVKYVEGFVENIIFRNEDNGYTVMVLKGTKKEEELVGTALWRTFRGRFRYTC